MQTFILGIQSFIPSFHLLDFQEEEMILFFSKNGCDSSGIAIIIKIIIGKYLIHLLHMYTSISYISSSY